MTGAESVVAEWPGDILVKVVSGGGVVDAPLSDVNPAPGDDMWDMLHVIFALREMGSGLGGFWYRDGSGGMVELKFGGRAGEGK